MPGLALAEHPTTDALRAPRVNTAATACLAQLVALGRTAIKQPCPAAKLVEQASIAPVGHHLVLPAVLESTVLLAVLVVYLAALARTQALAKVHVASVQT
jgi:hypothetical protein